MQRGLKESEVNTLGRRWAWGEIDAMAVCCAPVFLGMTAWLILYWNTYCTVAVHFPPKRSPQSGLRCSILHAFVRYSYNTWRCQHFLLFDRQKPGIVHWVMANRKYNHTLNRLYIRSDFFNIKFSPENQASERPSRCSTHVYSVVILRVEIVARRWEEQLSIHQLIQCIHIHSGHQSRTPEYSIHTLIHIIVHQNSVASTIPIWFYA